MKLIIKCDTQITRRSASSSNLFLGMRASIYVSYDNKRTNTQEKGQKWEASKIRFFFFFCRWFKRTWQEKNFCSTSKSDLWLRFF